MSKKGITRLIITVSIILTIGLIYWFIKSSADTADPWSIIPEESSVIIEIDNTGEFISSLSSDNNIWQSLKDVNEIELLTDKLKYTDSLFSTHNDISERIKNCSLFMALIPDTSGNTEMLLLIKPKHGLSLGTIEDALKSVLNRDYGILDVSGMRNVIHVVNASDESSFYISENDGILLIAESLQTIGLASTTHDDTDKQLKFNQKLSAIRSTARTKANVTIYTNYNNLGRSIRQVLNPDVSGAPGWISGFASWSDLEVLQKKEEIFFSGYTISDDNTFLGAMADQKPVKTTVFNVMPYNTNMFIWLGLSDFQSYFNKLHSEEQKASITKSVNYDINKLTNVIGGEIAIASNADQPQSVENNTWLIVSVNNTNAASNIMERIALNTGYNKHTTHNKHVIRKIAKSNFIENIFGSAFSEIRNNYYTFINDYLILANSEQSLINLIDNFDTGKTLDLNDNFKAFSDNITSKSNILVYTKPGEVLGRLNNIMDNFLLKQFDINDVTVNTFQGIALQFSKTATNMFFTNLYIKNSSTIHEENLALWKTQLDYDIVHGPYLVKDHNTKKENIIVFDKMSNMYLINSDGVIQWQKKLDAVPISDVVEVDYYKNRKIQYLFNTPDYIYLVDKNGRNVAGYPKKLHSKATNGLSLFDYLENKDYRIVIAQSDKKIHNYTIKTNEVKGWNKPSTQNIVIKPVDRLLANKKDYIIITDIDNNIKIVDRRGKRRIKVSKNIDKAENSGYYVNRTNSKGIIITTNKNGNLVYISASGRLRTTDFGKFSPNHFFLYEDFDDDNSKDFIYIDGNKLQVFDRFKKLITSYTFSSDITLPPKFFSFGRNEQVLGVVADKEKTIYLFDKNGNIIVSKGLVGETPFTVGRLEGNRNLNLVSASGNVLYDYLLR